MDGRWRCRMQAENGRSAYDKENKRNSMFDPTNSGAPGYNQSFTPICSVPSANNHAAEACFDRVLGVRGTQVVEGRSEDGRLEV